MHVLSSLIPALALVLASNVSCAFEEDSENSTEKADIDDKGSSGRTKKPSPPSTSTRDCESKDGCPSGKRCYYVGQNATACLSKKSQCHYYAAKECHLNSSIFCSGGEPLDTDHPHDQSNHEGDDPETATHREGWQAHFRGGGPVLLRLAGGSPRRSSWV